LSAVLHCRLQQLAAAMLTCDELFFCNKSHHKTRLCPLKPGVSIYPPQRQEATSPFVYFRLFPFSDLY